MLLASSPKTLLSLALPVRFQYFPHDFSWKLLHFSSNKMLLAIVLSVRGLMADLAHPFSLLALLSPFSLNSFLGGALGFAATLPET